MSYECNNFISLISTPDPYLQIIANIIYYLLIELELRPRNRFDVLSNTVKSIGNDQKKGKRNGITVTSNEMTDTSDQRITSVDGGRKIAGKVTLSLSY